MYKPSIYLVLTYLPIILFGRPQEPFWVIVFPMAVRIGNAMNFKQAPIDNIYILFSYT
jgi:hypothetical protein